MTSFRAPRRLSVPLVLAFLIAFALVLVPSSPASAVVTQGVSGKVTGPGGSPLSGIDVGFFQLFPDGNWGYVSSATTDASGTYAKDLTVGVWRVGFADPDEVYVIEYYDDVSDVDQANNVQVLDSQVTPNIDAQLAPHVPGHITGHIDGSDGDPIANAEVLPYVYDAGQWKGALQYAVETDAEGDYDLTVPPGVYWLEFDADGYFGEFYDDVATVEAGTQVWVSDGETVSGNDAVLQKSAALGGTVTLPAGADPEDSDGVVTVVDAVTGDEVQTSLDPDEETAPGSNTYPWYVDDLDAGNYRVEFGHKQGPATSEAEFYNDHPESAGSGSANPIALQAGQDRTDINATLRAGGTISGKVVDDNGDPVSDCYVLAVSQGFVTRAGTTGADGSFEVGGLTTGHYGLVVGATVPGSACPTPEYYTNPNGDLSPTPGGLIPVATAPGSDVTVAAPLVYLGSVAPAPSVTNTTPPTIPAGAPTVGTQITANPGTWNPADVTLSYQWRLQGGAITGATGQSYTPTAETVGLQLSVTVTASKTGYTSKSVTSNLTAPVVEVSQSPTQVQNFALPAVNGVTRVGSQLTAGRGAWTAGSTTSVQWLRNGDPVPGATGSTYTLGADDADAYIQVRVTATKPGLTPATRASTPVGPVQLGIMNLTGIPSILGTLKVGKVLRTSPPASSPAATSVRYRWFRNGVKIKGTRANDARYRLVNADRGKRISVRIKLLRPGYATSVTVVKRAGKVR